MGEATSDPSIVGMGWIQAVNSSQLKGRMSALLGQQLSDAEALQLLQDVAAGCGGLTIELDDARYRLIVREGKFSLKLSERRRVSSIPPFR